MVDDKLCQKYKQLKESESVKNTDMWVGSHTTETHEIHILDDLHQKFISAQLRYPYSMFQIFMEQIANALDIYNENKDKVDVFRFTFNKQNGEVSIYNNGPCIPIAKVLDKNKKEIWLPEMLCTAFLSSSNHDKSKSRISLGAHGIGLKAMTSLSKLMRVECVSDTQYYFQEIKDCNNIVNPPILNKVSKSPKEIKSGGTRFTYILDYSFYKNMPSDIYDTLDKLFISRIYQIAGYSGISCFYNDKKISVKGAKHLSEMFFGKNSVFFEVKNAEFPLSISVAPSDGNSQKISIINGGFIKAGDHFKYFENKFVTSLKPKVEKFLKDKVKWKKSLITSNISILIVGTIPDIKFGDQIKSELKMPNTKYFDEATWPTNIYDKIWAIVKDQLTVDHFINEQDKKGKTKKKMQNRDKYEPARKLKTPKSDLLIFEGDSARSSVRTAMTSQSDFSATYHGIFLLGGCPINVLNHMSSKIINGKTYEVSNDKIQNNIVWNDFMVVMNLKYDIDYGIDTNFKSLNYQKITMVVDKDDHGMGKIAPIFISNVCKFWPALLERDQFFAYMDTPVIRAFPNNKKLKVLSFLTNISFDNWKQENFGVNDVTGWKIKYYKGMASHNDKECINMFSNYENMRTCLTDEDKKAIILFADYFGKDSEPRKLLLSSSPYELSLNESSKSLPVSKLLNSFTKTEQQYNLLCKLNNWKDGLIFSHRKIVDGLIDHLKGKNEELKVYQLGGIISQKKGYHHGDASLNGSIIGLGQDYVGARNIPMCISDGQFGTRFQSGDAGAPRYVGAKTNPIVGLLFPNEDRHLLELYEEDGKAIVPVSMIPVMPLAIMETSHLPATGWAINRTARNPHDILENIKRMLGGKQSLKMRPWLPNWKGRVIEINDSEWCVGSCEYKNGTVVITELPYKEKNNNYIYGSKTSQKKANGSDTKPGLYSLKYIDHSTILDNSSKLQINISFKLVNGGYEHICKNYGNKYFSPLEDYLMLKSSMKHNLNYVNDDGSVREFGSYEGVFSAWFLERYKLYRKRFVYQKTLLKLKLFMLNEKMRFIKMHELLSLDKKRRTEIIKILEDKNFKKINIERLNYPGCRDYDKIEMIVFGNGASYKYLQLTYEDMCDEAITELQKKINKSNDDYVNLQSPTLLEDTWISDCETIIKQIDEAHKTSWSKNDYIY